MCHASDVGACVREGMPKRKYNGNTYRTGVEATAGGKRMKGKGPARIYGPDNNFSNLLLRPGMASYNVGDVRESVQRLLLLFFGALVPELGIRLFRQRSRW